MPVSNVQLTNSALFRLEDISQYVSLNNTRILEDILEIAFDGLPMGAVKPYLVRGIHVSTNYKKSIRVALSFKNKSNLRATAAAYGMRQGDVVELLLENYYEDHVEEWKERDRKFPPVEGEQLGIRY